MATNNFDVSRGALHQEMVATAASAAVGAALMLYFGFSNWTWPDYSALYTFSVQLFIWTLKAGGLLLVITAILLYLGWRPILVFDTVLCIAIAAAMLFSGVMDLIYRDVQGILSLLFGAMFLGAAKRSWRLYVSTRGVPSAMTVLGPEESEPVVELDPVARQAAMDRLLASKRREAVVAQTPKNIQQNPAAPVREVKAAAPAEPPSAPARAATKPMESAKKEEPPPEGFLAQLGRDDS